jgi:hypothetical protein
MSNRRYIELYSGNRNRVNYPLASSFEVPFSATRQNGTPNHSADPVGNGAIYYTWAGSDLISAGTVKTASDSPVYLTQSVGSLSTIYNYYIGYNSGYIRLFDLVK